MAVTSGGRTPQASGLMPMLITWSRMRYGGSADVVRRLEKRLGIVRADAVWAVAET